MKEGEFCWNELMTPNVEKALQFYQQLFGWETSKHEIGDMVYTVFKSGDKSIGGMMQTPKGMENQIPPHWMSYIYVEDLDKAVKKAESLGATIKKAVTSAGEFGRFAIIVDPTGAHIAFWQSNQ